MARHYWLVKQEPTAYSWARFGREGGTAWTGVRNFQARNHLRAMRPGDLVVFYHSGEEKAAVGLARVRRAAYPDPTASGGDWSCVDLEPLAPLDRRVPLSTMKADRLLCQMSLILQPRLSVCPMTARQFRRLLALADTTTP